MPETTTTRKAPHNFRDGDVVTQAGYGDAVFTVAGDTWRLTPSDSSPNVPRTLEGTPGTDHLALVANAAQGVAQAREHLEQTILAARAARVPLRAIADAAGLSHEHVRRLSTERGTQ